MEMQVEEVMVVRIYLAATEERVQLLMRRLGEWEHVRGATVFEGRSGFGDSGASHGDAIPTVIEFFDSPDKAMQVIASLRSLITPSHIVHWKACVPAE